MAPKSQRRGRIAHGLVEDLHSTIRREKKRKERREREEKEENVTKLIGNSQRGWKNSARLRNMMSGGEVRGEGSGKISSLVGRPEGVDEIYIDPGKHFRLD